MTIIQLIWALYTASTCQAHIRVFCFHWQNHQMIANVLCSILMCRQPQEELKWRCCMMPDSKHTVQKERFYCPSNSKGGLFSWVSHCFLLRDPLPEWLCTKTRKISWKPKTENDPFHTLFAVLQGDVRSSVTGFLLTKAKELASIGDQRFQGCGNGWESFPALKALCFFIMFFAPVLAPQRIE